MESNVAQEQITPLFSRRKKLLDRAVSCHGRLPGIRRLPLSVISIISLLAIVNIVVWIVVGIVLASHPTLASTAVLAYTLGLRHALDADHISAIDLMTRRLIAAGQRPVTVGTFFSLGHSTIVVITSIVVAATAAAISSRFDTFSKIGGIVGTSVSAAFLIVLSVLNMWVLVKLIKQLRSIIKYGEQASIDPWVGGGCLFTLFKKMFNLIDRPWKMYPLGVLFGLGFDTSSEIALLGITSLQGSSGTTLWLILIFPILFTAGMCLIDTTDGALMMTLYTSTTLARDQTAILYYSIILTSITIVAALAIGIVQLLTLVLNLKFPDGVDGDGAGSGFWNGLAVLGDHYEVLGGAICASFVVFGLLSVLLYRPWRSYVDGLRVGAGARAPASSDVDEGVLVEDGIDGRERRVGVFQVVDDAADDDDDSAEDVAGDHGANRHGKKTTAVTVRDTFHGPSN